MQLVLIGLGGFFGTLPRYGVDSCIRSLISHPLGPLDHLVRVTVPKALRRSRLARRLTLDGLRQ